MLSLWKKFIRKMGRHFILCRIPMLVLLLCLSVVPITAYADEGSPPEMEEMNEEEESGDGEEAEEGEEVKDGGNAFLDAMLDSVFGVSEDGNV